MCSCYVAHLYVLFRHSMIKQDIVSVGCTTQYTIVLYKYVYIYMCVHFDAIWKTEIIAY